jgi:hypothetical protein
MNSLHEQGFHARLRARLGGPIDHRLDTKPVGISISLNWQLRTLANSMLAVDPDLTIYSDASNSGWGLDFGNFG